MLRLLLLLLLLLLGRRRGRGDQVLGMIVAAITMRRLTDCSLFPVPVSVPIPVRARDVEKTIPALVVFVRRMLLVLLHHT